MEETYAALLRALASHAYRTAQLLPGSFEWAVWSSSAALAKSQRTEEAVGNGKATLSYAKQPALN